MKKNVILAVFMALSCFAFIISSTPAALSASFLDVSNQTGLEDAAKALNQNPDKPSDIRLIVIRIVEIALSFLAIIFIVLLIFAGFKWMTSAGDEGKVDDAKKIITSAIIGLLIVMASYAITVFITKKVLKQIKTPSGSYEINAEQIKEIIKN